MTDRAEAERALLAQARYASEADTAEAIAEMNRLLRELLDRPRND